MASKTVKDGSCQAFAESIPETDECVIWPFYKRKNGHGRWGDELASARVLKMHEPKPSPMHIACHSVDCISPACVNPKHLRWDTKRGNQLDTIVEHGGKGRIKLTSKDDERIAELVQQGHTHKDIAHWYGISDGHVTKVVKRWRER